MPVVKVHSRRTVLGGAANVLLNLAALGCRGIAFGVVGDDEAGRRMVGLCSQQDFDSRGLITAPDRPTTVKTRVLADRQQVVRIDEEDDSPLPEELRAQVLRQVEEALAGKKLDGVILEDYNKGLFTSAFAQRLSDLAREHGVFSALDPHPGNPLAVRGLSLMTPNRMEAFVWASRYLRETVLPIEKDEPLLDVGARLLERHAPETLLITLGAHGMALFQPGQPLHHVPTVAQEVFDVSGAGDAVIATFTAGRLAGLSPHDATVFANHAGGVVVGKVGTVPVDRPALIESFERHEG